MNIKEYIQTNLYRKDGKLNSAILRREKFLESKEYSTIVELTRFLPIECSVTERIHCIVNDIQSTRICPICNIRACVFLPHAGAGYSNTCNEKKCIANHEHNIKSAKETRLKNYGEFVSPKHRETFARNSKDNQKKSADVIKKKYGVDNISQIYGCRDKARQTLIDNYGVDHWSKTEENQDKIFNNRLKKFQDCISVITPSEEQLKNFPCSNNRYSFICSICGNNDSDISYYSVIWRLNNFGTSCSACSKLKFGSVFQNEIYEFITSLKISCKRNAKPLLETKKEIDIYIEDKKIGFECNGLYWHSAEHLITRGKPVNNDYIKYQEFKHSDIRIYCIMEDEWKHRRDIVESRIKNILGLTDKRIYARNCEIRLIEKHVAKEFIEKNHIQGYHGCSIAYGLFHHDNLVSVMSFTDSNITRKLKNTWEISRFCSLLDTSVIGAAGKLFSQFEKDIKPQFIVSYADTRWSDGNVYKQLGFSFEKQTTCNYWYIDRHNIKRIHRFNLRKKSDEPKDVSEEDLRRQQGYLRIYDYGSSKWIKRYDIQIRSMLT